MELALITGTNGFIGKNLYNRLIETHEVFELNEDIINYHDDWVKLLEDKLHTMNPDVIFHVGACSDTLETNVNYIMERNFESTKILCDYAYKKEIPFIYSSSAANYGTNGLYPSNLYGWSKYVAEQYVLKSEGICLRYFNVYGPHENNKGKMASVAYQMIEKNKNGQEIKLFPGNPKRDFVYVNDIVSANIFAYENFYKLPNLTPYEVGSGEARTFEDVLNILDLPYTYHPEKEIPQGYQFYTKSEKKHWMSGWEPKYNLEKGLKEYKEWINQKL